MEELEKVRKLIDKMIHNHINKGTDLSIINELEKIDTEIFKIIESKKSIL